MVFYEPPYGRGERNPCEHRCVVKALEAEVARLRAAIVYLIKVREVVCQHEPYEGSEQTCAKCKADAALAPEVP